jgi:hypothetical protein
VLKTRRHPTAINFKTLERFKAMTTKKGSTKRPAPRKASEVIDLAAEGRKVAQAARLVRSVFSHEAVPDFLTDAMMTALAAAEAKTGIAFWQVEPADEEGGPYMGEDFDMKGLADLFAVTSPASFRLDKPDFAALLSTALNHPDCPAEIYNAVGDGDCLNIKRWDTPAAIRLALGTAEQIEAPKPAGARPRRRGHRAAAQQSEGSA